MRGYVFFEIWGRHIYIEARPRLISPQINITDRIVLCERQFVFHNFTVLISVSVAAIVSMISQLSYHILA